MKKNRGFTLIEILIVVIIIAVLAALVLPRFFQQTEAGFIAEAQQNLGVIRRAQTNAADVGVVVPALTTANFAAGVPALGMAALPQTNYNYSCNAAGALCTAARVGTPANTVTLTAAGAFGCTGTYALITTQRGCRAG